MNEPFHEQSRPLPHNLEAERSLLGAVILHEEALVEATGLVRPAQFYREAHRRIFARLVEMVKAAIPIELVTLKNELVKTNDLGEVGGPAYLASLLDGVPRSANIAHYASIVVENWLLREVIIGCSKLVNRAYLAEDTAQAIIADTERMVIALAEGAVRKGFVQLGDLIPPFMERLEEIALTKQSITGLRTGFHELDDLTRGLQPGSFVILGARPSMGKTSLAFNIADHVAGERDQIVAAFSLEMSAEELIAREVSSAARIDSYRLQAGYMGEKDWAKVSHAIEHLSRARLFVDDSPKIGVFEIHAKCRRLKAEHGRLDLVVIDYLQLMASDEAIDNRALQLGGITRELKVMARDLKVPVVALSQLSRETDKRKGGDHKPQLSDLRESGSLEQDADIVLLLYREEMYNPDDEANHGIADVSVAKHRNGPTGHFKLAFLKEYTKFENLSSASAPVVERLPYGERV